MKCLYPSHGFGDFAEMNLWSTGARSKLPKSVGKLREKGVNLEDNFRGQQCTLHTRARVICMSASRCVCDLSVNLWCGKRMAVSTLVTMRLDRIADHSFRVLKGRKRITDKLWDRLHSIAVVPNQWIATPTGGGGDRKRNGLANCANRGALSRFFVESISGSARHSNHPAGVTEGDSACEWLTPGRRGAEP